MRFEVLLACAFVASSIDSAAACDLVKDPQPEWEHMIDEAEVVFVGEVIALLPRKEGDWGDHAVFDVESPIKGIETRYFVAESGANSCMASFQVGQRVIFAAKSTGLDGQLIFSADDTGYRQDPTVYLSDPPTTEQLAQLSYLKRIAVDR